MENEKIDYRTKSNSQKNLATFIKLSLIKRLIISELLIEQFENKLPQLVLHGKIAFMTQA